MERRDGGEVRRERSVICPFWVTCVCSGLRCGGVDFERAMAKKLGAVAFKRFAKLPGTTLMPASVIDTGPVSLEDAKSTKDILVSSLSLPHSALLLTSSFHSNLKAVIRRGKKPLFHVQQHPTQTSKMHGSATSTPQNFP